MSDPASNRRREIARWLRLLASGGYAEQDAEVVEEIFDAAEQLAQQVLADPGASNETKQAARTLVQQLSEDAFDRG